MHIELVTLLLERLEITRNVMQERWKTFQKAVEKKDELELNLNKHFKNGRRFVTL